MTDKKIPFVGLHAHSVAGSIFDAIGYPDEHMDFCYENGGEALALTDHGNMNGFSHQFLHWKKMKAEGLNFIARYENEIYFTFASYIYIRDAKKMVISQLNKVGQIRTYIGNTPTNPEGYVVSTNNYAMKFVDDDFRKANILFGIQ